MKKSDKGLKGGMNDITPVHWHIATMVVEEERMASNKPSSTNKPRRSYHIENAGSGESSKNLGDYASMYSYFQNMILDPNEGGGEAILFDYYRVRGIIARDLNLFSHDRNRLLSMLDSEMRSISGSSILDSTVNIIAGCETGSIIPMPQAVTLPPPTTNKAPRINDFLWR